MIRLTVRKPIALVAVLMIAAGILGACSSASDDTQPEATGPDPTSAPSSELEPFVLKTLDPDFDAKYRITMDLARRLRGCRRRGSGGLRER